MNEATIALFGTVGAGVIYKVLDAVKKTGKVKKEYLPIISVVVAGVVGAMLGLLTNESIAMGALLGLAFGSAPVAGHQIKKSVQKLRAKGE